MKNDWAYDETKFPFGPMVRSVDDMLPKERQVYEVLDLIVVEFETDPMAVQCFDLRVVERAKEAVKPFRQLLRNMRGAKGVRP